MIAHGYSFSICSKIAEKGGGKLTVRDQKEADRALISVSPGVNVHLGCESQRNEVVLLEESQRRGTGSTPIDSRRASPHSRFLTSRHRRNPSNVCWLAPSRPILVIMLPCCRPSPRLDPSFWQETLPSLFHVPDASPIPTPIQSLSRPVPL